jgi:hypothetical protein
VWKMEGKKVGPAAGAKSAGRQWLIGFVLVFFVPAIFGISNALGDSKWGVPAAIYVTVSLLHFWMDGFIWSVRKKAV